MAAPVAAKETGSGQTARSEQEYLKFVIDHHYGALRMAELAAGTNVHRSAALLPSEGTSPTPGSRTTVAKAALDEIKSIGRRDNRVQREEILDAQVLEIDEMRHLLCERYSDSHYQPFQAHDRHGNGQ